jgi:hypothetical protein
MSAEVATIESAGPLRRGLEVWYAAFGGIGAWTVHLLFVVSAEHWSHLHPHWSWTLHAATAVCAAATLASIGLAWRLRSVASGNDPAGVDDGGQLLFLAHLGLLVGIINLALILLEGTYAVFIPRA